MWARMYSTMRVRGQTGGFMLDAIAGVDLALWDLAGKLAGKPVSALLDLSPRRRLPAYLSGASGAGPQERAEYAAQYFGQGIGLVKLYFESSWKELLATADALPRGMEFAVDALWHMPPLECVAMAKELDARGARWLECPLYPEEVEAHAALARSIHTPIAIGESYRTVFEMQPFIERGVVGIAQPDLGRCGITEAMRIAQAHGGETIPHVSIAMGPQIAAALHFAAAARQATMCEFNPNVLAMANRFLAEPLEMRNGEFTVPQAPGLGVVWNREFDALLGRV
jgi:D-galactarolactone cycloisomerase